METLTLARYILEMSLMEYDLIEEKDSLLAAAALLLALRMKKNNIGWSITLEFYSGYQEAELLSLMNRLNAVISPPFHPNIKTIRNKYSHRWVLILILFFNFMNFIIYFQHILRSRQDFSFGCHH